MNRNSRIARYITDVVTNTIANTFQSLDIDDLNRIEQGITESQTERDNNFVKQTQNLRMKANALERRLDSLIQTANKNLFMENKTDVKFIQSQTSKNYFGVSTENVAVQTSQQISQIPSDSEEKSLQPKDEINEKTINEGKEEHTRNSEENERLNSTFEILNENTNYELKEEYTNKEESRIVEREDLSEKDSNNIETRKEESNSQGATKNQEQIELKENEDFTGKAYDERQRQDKHESRKDSDHDEEVRDKSKKDSSNHIEEHIIQTRNKDQNAQDTANKETKKEEKVEKSITPNVKNPFRDKIRFQIHETQESQFDEEEDFNMSIADLQKLRPSGFVPANDSQQPANMGLTGPNAFSFENTRPKQLGTNQGT